MTYLTLTRPDDWYLHLRDGDALAAVLPDSARRFARAMIMPNLDPPVRTVIDARAYRARILAALPAGMSFEQAGALDRLEAFASFHGADFYSLPRNTGRITLERQSWTVPEELRFGKETGVPLRAGETIAWRLVKPLEKQTGCQG